MTEINKLDKDQLETTWNKTIALRGLVLDWAKETGFGVADLVSRTAEHQIEMFYGRKVLEE